MLSLNAKALKAIDNAVIASHNLEASAAIVREAVQGQDREAVREAVIHRFAAAARITLTVKSTGRLVWPKDDPRTDAAKRACNRFIEMVLGKAPTQAVELEVPADILAIAKKLVAACNEYEQAGRLIATAIAKAKAE